MTEGEIFTIDENAELALITMIQKCPTCSGLISFRKSLELNGMKKAEMAAELEPPPDELTDADRQLLSDLQERGQALSAVEHFRHLYGMQAMSDSPKKLAPFETFQRTKSFPCPHCKTMLQARTRVQILDFIEAKDVGLKSKVEKRIARGSIEKATPSQQSLYALFKSTGLLDLFMAANALHGNGSHATEPRSIARLIEVWFQKCIRMEQVSRSAALRLYDDLKTRNLFFYHSNGIVAVIANGYIKTFLSKSQVLDEPKAVLSLNKESGRVEEVWRKTPFGYVVGDGAFFNALRLESMAASGNATGKQRRTQSYTSKAEKAEVQVTEAK